MKLAERKLTRKQHERTYAMGIQPTNGKLAVLTAGMGSVATTFFAGVEAIKAGISHPIGSYTQLAKINFKDQNQGLAETSEFVRDLLPFAKLNELVFGGWDIFDENAYEAAKYAKVLDESLLEKLREPLSKIRPMPAVFDKNYVKRLQGTHVKTGKNKMDLALQLRKDIRNFLKNNDCDRAVIVWCGSTEVHNPNTSVHENLHGFEKGLEMSDEAISPSQIYAYAALKEGVPYANGSPNRSNEIPAIQDLAKMMSTPICGSDFKTGQTLLKTIIAPGIAARMLGVAGWYSTNILGNRDGEVLDDPGSFRSKEVSKTGVLERIFSKEDQPDLYKNMAHLVRINYYPPRGDNKEGWDNIDIFGWLGYQMQIKVNFLCRDSILAAPLVLDLALFMDIASRSKMGGIQDWLSFFFKAPLTQESELAEHALHRQLVMLENKILSLSPLTETDSLRLVHYAMEEPLTGNKTASL
jgi:myo-inositol-1-phosphate synthase